MIGKSGLLLVGLAVAVLAKDMVLDFEDVPVGTLPSGWKSAATHPKKNLATWEVQQEGTNKMLTLHKLDRKHGGMFNLCFSDKKKFLDGEITVKFRANSGDMDQGGGIMWRVQDGDNYLVARFNPLEDNFRFYSVIDGRRHELASADVKLGKGWHEMKIVQKGDLFVGYLDGKKLLEYHDCPLKEKGGVGVWTKADAATSFDEFKVLDGK